MRIYMAGLYQVRSFGTIHALVSQSVSYPYMLESFHYICDSTIPQLIRLKKESIFLDSGAFSLFTQGVKVDLKQYARFVDANRDIIHAVSNLDVIGQGHEQESYDRQKALEGMLGTGIVSPVHHVRDHDDWLKRYLDEGYDYIFLGGMVPESTPVLRQWLDHIWHEYLTNTDGSAKVKVHGFGLTTLELIFRYPWFSVDSTSWVMASRFGSIFLDFPQPDGSVKDFKIDFSTRSMKRYDASSWHFNSLKPDEQEVVLARLAQLETERPKNQELEEKFKHYLGVDMGYNPAALGKCYGMRDVANIEYFRRAMDRRVNTYIRAQETLF